MIAPEATAYSNPLTPWRHRIIQRLSIPIGTPSWIEVLLKALIQGFRLKFTGHSR
jgi:hypothetical protein